MPSCLVQLLFRMERDWHIFTIMNRTRFSASMHWMSSIQQTLYVLLWTVSHMMGKHHTIILLFILRGSVGCQRSSKFTRGLNCWMSRMYLYHAPFVDSRDIVSELTKMKCFLKSWCGWMLCEKKNKNWKKYYARSNALRKKRLACSYVDSILAHDCEQYCIKHFFRLGSIPCHHQLETTFP